MEIDANDYINQIERSVFTNGFEDQFIMTFTIEQHFAVDIFCFLLAFVVLTAQRNKCSVQYKFNLFCR